MAVVGVVGVVVGVVGVVVVVGVDVVVVAVVVVLWRGQGKFSHSCPKMKVAGRKF